MRILPKRLITSGCSFSDTSHKWIVTWPRHLARLLPNHKFRNYGLGSQGNGLISRGAMYGVIEALKQHEPHEIFVAIMWSGASRHDYRCADPGHLRFVQQKVHNGWIRNPTQFVEGADDNWVILNANWGDNRPGGKNPDAETYYKYFYDEIGHAIYSIEHILRLQLFLKSKNIPYFFTNFSDENIVRNELKTHPEIEYLHNQIDFSQYLPVTSEHRWCYENSKFTHLWPDNWKNIPWIHPTSEMHKEFVDQVVAPWIKEKYPGQVFDA